MSTLKQRLSALFAGLALAATASGQDGLTPPDGDEDVREYQVEVIFFRYAENVSAGTEVFPPDPPPELGTDTLGESMNADQDVPEFSDTAREPEAAGQSMPQGDELEPEPIADYTIVADEALTLGGTWDRLERLDAYQPLLHFGWRQRLTPYAEPVPISLREFGASAPGLSGDLKLYLSRFLHLGVDLQQAVDAAAGGANRNPGNPLYAYGDERNRRLETGEVFYRIQEDRILKNGELRYFDHPKMGLLARVERVAAEPAPDEPTSPLPPDGTTPALGEESSGQ
ncbi:MAG: CsiV family protein [Pseudomonadota bacterium]